MFERAGELAPPGMSANSWYFLGRSRMELGRPREAVEAFERAMEAGFDDPETRLQLARALRESGSPGAALAHAEPVLARFALRAPANLERARSLVALGQAEPAAEAYRLFLQEAAPDHPARDEAESFLDST